MKLFKVLAATLPIVPSVSFEATDHSNPSEIDLDLSRAVEMKDSHEGHNHIFVADSGTVSCVESGLETQAAPNKFERI